MKPINLIKITAIAATLSLTALSAYAGDVVKFGMALPAGVENAWSASLLASFNKVKAAQPHGISIEYAYTENLYGDDALTAMEKYAESGYDIIWAHGAYADQVEELKDEFPDTMFVMIGSGNRVMSGNAYSIYLHLHETSYLAGIFAASESKSNILGIVGLFPADDVNDQVNAFKAGARSITPNVKVNVTFIESWYDPLKAAEAANAQIAAGADIIFQLGETFETCRENGIMCIGNYIDSSAMAPDVVPVSTLAKWEPQINYVLDEWKAHKDTGKAYNAPNKTVWFTMAQGGGDLSAVSKGFTDKIAASTIAAIDKARQSIISGDHVVKLDMSLPVSD